MACPRREQCSLHRSLGMKQALRVWESFYCEGAYLRCERYKLSVHGVVAPARLLPNGRIQDDLELPPRRASGT